MGLAYCYFKARKPVETFNFKLTDYEKCGFRAFMLKLRWIKVVLKL